MVGAGGFEPPNTGSKVPRLTAWPRPRSVRPSASSAPPRSAARIVRAGPVTVRVDPEPPRPRRQRVPDPQGRAMRGRDRRRRSGRCPTSARPGSPPRAAPPSPRRARATAARPRARGRSSTVAATAAAPRGGAPRPAPRPAARPRSRPARAARTPRGSASGKPGFTSDQRQVLPGPDRPELLPASARQRRAPPQEEGHVHPERDRQGPCQPDRPEPPAPEAPEPGQHRRRIRSSPPPSPAATGMRLSIRIRSPVAAARLPPHKLGGAPGQVVRSPGTSGAVTLERDVAVARPRGSPGPPDRWPT